MAKKRVKGVKKVGNKANKPNESNKANKSKKSKKSNKPNKSNKSNKLNKANKANKTNESNKTNKLNNDKVQRVTKVVSGQVWTFKKPKVKVIPVGSEVNIFKFLGFCRCGCQVGSGDLESKFIYKCPGCGKRGRKSELDENRGGGERVLSRKEYMETINVEHLESPYTASEDVPPEILKKFEEED